MVFLGAFSIFIKAFATENSRKDVLLLLALLFIRKNQARH